MVTVANEPSAPMISMGRVIGALYCSARMSVEARKPSRRMCKAATHGAGALLAQKHLHALLIGKISNPVRAAERNSEKVDSEKVDWIIARARRGGVTVRDCSPFVLPEIEHISTPCSRADATDRACRASRGAGSIGIDPISEHCDSLSKSRNVRSTLCSARNSAGRIGIFMSATKLHRLTAQGGPEVPRRHGGSLNSHEGQSAGVKID